MQHGVGVYLVHEAQRVINQRVTGASVYVCVGEFLQYVLQQASISNQLQQASISMRATSSSVVLDGGGSAGAGWATGWVLLVLSDLRGKHW